MLVVGSALVHDCDADLHSQLKHDCTLVCYAECTPGCMAANLAMLGISVLQSHERWKESMYVPFPKLG